MVFDHVLSRHPLLLDTYSGSSTSVATGQGLRVASQLQACLTIMATACQGNNHLFFRNGRSNSHGRTMLESFHCKHWCSKVILYSFLTEAANSTWWQDADHASPAVAIFLHTRRACYPKRNCTSDSIRNTPKSPLLVRLLSFSSVGGSLTIFIQDALPASFMQTLRQHYV
jgi:hypothetical protein